MAKEDLIKHRFTSDQDRAKAAEAGRKGAAVRWRKARERKTVAQALREVLSEPVAKGSKVTRVEAIAMRALDRLYKRGEMRDVKILAEILGELKISLEHTGMAINIQTSPEGEECIEKILNGEDD